MLYDRTGNVLNRADSVPADVEAGVLASSLLADPVFQASLNDVVEEIVSGLNIETNFVGTQANLTAITGMSNGAKIHVLYRSAINDGGGGDWVWDAAATDTADGGTILQADAGGTGRWKRVFDGVNYEAAWFGAKADGVTDNYAIMSSLLDSLPAGAELKTPSGVMMMSAKKQCNRGNITLDFRKTTFKPTEAALDDPNFSYYFHFVGTSLASKIRGVTIYGGSFDASAWRSGTNRLGSGSCPDQTGMSSTQIKLASTASASNNYYNGMYVFILEGTGKGQEAFISAYNGSTKVATVSAAWTTQPDATSIYGILLTGGDSTNQATRGLGRLGFTYCEDVKILYGTYITGGHGAFDFRGTKNTTGSEVFVEDIHENAWNYLDDCSNGKLSKFSFIDCGEGLDHGYCYNMTANSGLIELSAESDDEGIDINGLTKGVFSDIIIHGGNNSINIHAAYSPTYKDITGLASSRISFTNVHGYDFRNAGFIVQLGRGTATGTLPSQSGMTTSQFKLPTNATTNVYTDDSLNGQTITITGGTGSGQTAVITDYVASTKVATISSTWSPQPDNTSTYSIGPTGPQANDFAYGFQLANCHFESTQSGAVGIWLGETLTSLPARVADIDILGCHVKTVNVAFRSAFAKNVNVLGGSYKSSGDRAVHLGYNATYFSEDVVIDGPICSANTASTSDGCIDAESGIGYIIKNCTILDNPGGRGIYTEDCRNVQVIDNTIRACSREGIYVFADLSAFTDTTWSGTTSRNMLGTDNNLNWIVEGNKIYDWGSGAASMEAVRMNFNVNTAVDIRGWRIKDNYVRLQSVSVNGHVGIRLGHHASVTGCDYDLSENDLDRNLATRFNLSSLTTLHNTAVMAFNKAHTTSLNMGVGYRKDLRFYQDNVAANQSAVELACSGVAGTFSASATRAVMIRPGTVISICVKSNAARSAGTLTVEVYKNSTATGLTAVLDGTNTTFKATPQRAKSGDVASADVFAAGDELNVRITTDGSWAPTTADIQVIVEIED